MHAIQKRTRMLWATVLATMVLVVGAAFAQGQELVRVRVQNDDGRLIAHGEVVDGRLELRVAPSRGELATLEAELSNGDIELYDVTLSADGNIVVFGADFDAPIQEFVGRYGVGSVSVEVDDDVGEDLPANGDAPIREDDVDEDDVDEDDVDDDDVDDDGDDDRDDLDDDDADDDDRDDLDDEDDGDDDGRDDDRDDLDDEDDAFDDDLDDEDEADDDRNDDDEADGDDMDDQGGSDDDDDGDDDDDEDDEDDDDD